MIKTRTTELGLQVMTKIWKNEQGVLCEEVILSVPEEQTVVEFKRPERQRNWP